MNKPLLLLIFLMFCMSLSWSQVAEKPLPRKPVTGSTHLSATKVHKVLFATNEDCALIIDGERRGTVLKSDFLYLDLPEGSYRYAAVGQHTNDELIDSFRVISGGTNEVFIDLLYLIDLKNAERELAKTRLTGNNPQRPDKIGNSQPEARKLSLKDAEVAVINSLLGNMVEIKGGSFVMGNGKSRSADEVEHPVTVSSFFFSKYEVTQHQWETLMGYNPSINKGCATCPVDNVSWEEAMKFIRKLNVISQRKFRLPTEAEWEYVYRIGGKAEIEQAGGQEEYIKKTAWYFSNADKKTHPVGIKQPNAAGIFDLTGNVSEWCLDWYGAYYYKEDFNQLNPEGPPLGKEKVIRGGNYKDFAGDRFRPSFRNKRNPVEKGSETGFRLVLEMPNRE